jgi:hypothetical protein
MKIRSLTTPTAPGKKARPSRLAARIITPLAVAAACLGLLAGVASADEFSWYPGVGLYTFNHQFGENCSIEIGPVYDPSSNASGYDIIGGVTIYGCSYRHTFAATVSEYYYYNGWHLANAYTRSATFTNVTGFGGRILETGRICGTQPLFWYTGVAINEYDASGRFVQEVTRYSHESSVAVAARSC